MTRCLGTRIESASDDERPITVLLSDLHLTPAGGAPLAALAAVLERARARADRSRVVVLGDLFDAWATDAQLRMPGWVDAVDALRATTAAGVPVTVLHGNRDFLLGGAFARATGCRVVAGGLELRAGGRRVLCLHGDELCLRDLAYQRAKRLLRSWPVRAASRVLPARLALRAGGQARRRSAVVQRDYHAARTDLVAAAIDRVFAETGADVLVCGHVHRPAHHRRWRGGGGELFVLPAFDEAGEHLEHADGRFAVVGADGAPRPDLPARALG